MSPHGLKRLATRPLVRARKVRRHGGQDPIRGAYRFLLEEVADASIGIQARSASVNWTVVDLMRFDRMAGAQMRLIIRRVSATETGDARSVISGADARLRSRGISVDGAARLRDSCLHRVPDVVDQFLLRIRLAEQLADTGAR